MSTEKKERKTWKEEETEVLIEEVDKRQSILFGKLSAFVSNQRKRSQWQAATAAVNAVSDTERTVDEITKKWRDIKSRTKKKEAIRQQELRKTGGGEASVEDLTAIERKVLGVIGNVCISGIPGGIESGATETKNKVPDEDVAGNQYISAQQKHIDRASEADSPVEEINCVRPARKKRRVQTVTTATDRLVHIEEERLKIEKERLAIEKERLHVEKQRLETEKERLKAEKQKYETTKGQSVIDNAHCTYFNLN